MALSSDWKMGKCLDWYTELPYLNRPRESPTFMIQRINCFFNFMRHSNNYYYLYLKSKSANDKFKSFSLTITMLNDHGPEKYKRNEIMFYPNQYLLCVHESCFMKEEVNLKDGIFVRFIFMFEHTVTVEPVFMLDEKINEKQTQADLMLSLETDIQYLSLDFSELLKRKDHSDVTVLCNGGTILAHRAILAARSKTFSDMLQDGTEESRSGLINMTTTEKSVMELCLEFIYKGKITNMPLDKASNLYVLGHVLKISSLSKMCADLMTSNLSEDNYIPYLVLTEKYHDDYFKCALIKYICEHTELLKSENWEKFEDKHPRTAIDVHRKLRV